MTSATASLWRSSVGKKAAMAISGVIFVGWLFAHMAGNLLVFAGPEAINEYGEFIQHGTHGAVWIMRAVLVGALVVHVWSSVSLLQQARRARPVAYAGGRVDQTTTGAARSMRYGGLALLIYLVYHLLHMTVGSIHPHFVRGDVFHNLVTAFQEPVVTATYLLATVFLSLHLYHGVWSAFQTLGLDNPRWNAWRRPFALGTAVVIGGGFAAVPIAIALGVVS